ncbi:hypothetical protein EW146_g5115 [Bondarzewia mesenterica]|uniref:C2H2-type domain-containing protein n=1 Tax=Bondarzewia mesenterica TaxID=1095465 RepID=A0A4S4LSE7_9AGAM|nr:hypothetical protein EW146_g5115 [Bondarzewia mesenterica]
MQYCDYRDRMPDTYRVRDNGDDTARRATGSQPSMTETSLELNLTTEPERPVAPSRGFRAFSRDYGPSLLIPIANNGRRVMHPPYYADERHGVAMMEYPRTFVVMYHIPTAYATDVAPVPGGYHPAYRADYLYHPADSSSAPLPSIYGPMREYSTRHHPNLPPAHTAPPPPAPERWDTARRSNNVAAAGLEMRNDYRRDEIQVPRFRVKIEPRDDDGVPSSSTTRWSRTSGVDEGESMLRTGEQDIRYLSPSRSGFQACQEREVQYLYPHQETSEGSAEREKSLVTRALSPDTVQMSAGGPSTSGPPPPTITHETASGSTATTTRVKRNGKNRRKIQAPTRWFCLYCKNDDGRPWDFTRRTDLERHMKSLAHAKPSFQCPYCPLALTRKSTLEGHVERKHWYELVESGQASTSGAKLEDLDEN